MIHEFAQSSIGDCQPSAVTCLVQSPAIDVIAVGYASGEIVVHDIRTNERLLRMFQDGPVRCLSFRGGKRTPS